MSANSLYFGDNLDILRSEIKSESVDLIYLDPPFNSKAAYNRLFKSRDGRIPQAQRTAFEDTWIWGDQAEREFTELVRQSNVDVSEMMQALRNFLGENDVMAYLTMMANRLLELHRVLKNSGCLYLHCDPTASHYLKVVMDGIFGNANFSNEIIWKRTTTKNDYKQGAVNWPRVHDTILMYYKNYEAAKDAKRFNQPFEQYDEQYLQNFYRHTDPDGRRYRLSDLTAPGRGTRGHPQFEFLGVTRYWRHNKEKMDQLYREGRIVQAKPGGVPAFKRYLDEMPGVAAGDVWTELRPVQGIGREFLGYQTQKPLPLLERIISASSKEGDTILDPFCGCGTAIHAAEKLRRRWIGIDITHVAISLVEDRLRAAFPAIAFDVHGVPKDLDSARDLAQRDKYEFEWWACSLVKAEPYQRKKKGADGGIDGVIYFQDDKTGHKKAIVSVKAGEHVSVPMIRDLGHVVNREKASIGLFVTLAKPTAPMRQEAVKAGYYESPVGASFPKIQILTVEGLLKGIERARYPDLMQGGLMSPKAKREVDAIQLGFDSAAYLSEVPATEETPRKPARVARATKPRKASRKTA